MVPEYVPYFFAVANRFGRHIRRKCSAQQQPSPALTRPLRGHPLPEGEGTIGFYATAPFVTVKNTSSKVGSFSANEVMRTPAATSCSNKAATC